MRIKIAEAVALSRRTIPAFALDRWVEIAALERARQELGPKIERDGGVKVTVTDLLLQAMSDTLAGQPAILDRWVEEGGKAQRLSPGSIDIGLVVAVEGGMMIPVLTDLGGRSLAEIARARRDAVQRVRTGRLIAADSAPASISLSNLGQSGIDRFEAIINPGQASILAIGRAHDRVIARGGAPVVARGFHLTFSVDHRLIDGVAVRRFWARWRTGSSSGLGRISLGPPCRHSGESRNPGATCSTVCRSPLDPGFRRDDGRGTSTARWSLSRKQEGSPRRHGGHGEARLYSVTSVAPWCIPFLSFLL